MNKPTEIEAKSLYDFQEMVNQKHFSISKAIVDSILGNLKTRKKNILVLSVKCMEEGEIYDITLDKKHFAETLQENLPHFSEREMYGKCAEIQEAIENLNKVKPKK